MSISQTEFEALKPGDDVRVISIKYGRSTCSAARVIALTKTGVKVELLSTQTTVIFTKPDDYRGNDIWSPHCYLATSEDWSRVQSANYQEKLRGEARELVKDVDWRNIKRDAALKLVDELREKVLQFHKN